MTSLVIVFFGQSVGVGLCCRCCRWLGLLLDGSIVLVGRQLDLLLGRSLDAGILILFRGWTTIFLIQQRFQTSDAGGKRMWGLRHVSVGYQKKTSSFTGMVDAAVVVAIHDE